MTELYYPVHCAMYPSGGGTVLLVNRNDSTSLAVSAVEAGYFASLLGARTIEEHLQTLSRVNRYNLSSTKLRDLLDRWIASGLLRSREMAEVDCMEDARRRFTPVCGVITADRSGSLETWLETRLSHAHFRERTVPVIVCDDSRNQTEQSANRRTLELWTSDYPGKLIYFGAEERLRFSRELEAACSGNGVDVRLLRFALFGPEESHDCITVGANRNGFLLLSGGSDLLFSDDDIFYRFYSLSELKHQKTRLSGVDHLPVQFYSSSEKLFDDVVQVNSYDLFGKIEQWLGRPVKVDGYTHADLEYMTARHGAALENRKLSVAAVSTGYCGARWFDDPAFVLVRRFFSDDSFYYSEDEYESIMRNGLNIISSDVPIVADGDFMQAGTMALDGSILLPPFFPVDRHEDPCFSSLLFLLNPETAPMYLPVALYHDPDRKKPFSVQALADTMPSLGRIHKLLLGEFSRQLIGETPEARLQEIVRRYFELSVMPPAAFTDYLTTLTTGVYRKKKQFTLGLLKAFGDSPEWWARDVGRVIAGYDKVIQEPLKKIPPQFQSWLGLYGELLEAWPTIRKHAAEISPLNR